MDDQQPTASEDDALLTTFLANHDVPCPRCGYNLRTLAGHAWHGVRGEAEA